MEFSVGWDMLSEVVDNLDVVSCPGDISKKALLDALVDYVVLA
jgi:hypothetical protein